MQLSKTKWWSQDLNHIYLKEIAHPFCFHWQRFGAWWVNLYCKGLHRQDRRRWHFTAYVIVSTQTDMQRLACMKANRKKNRKKAHWHTAYASWVLRTYLKPIYTKRISFEREVYHKRGYSSQQIGQLLCDLRLLTFKRWYPQFGW